MRFRTQDLLVSLTPRVAAGKDAQLCIFHTTICIRPTVYCRFPTLAPCFTGTVVPCRNLTFDPGGCTAFASCGGPGGSACDTTYVCPGSWWEVETIEDLATIKDDLRQVLTQLDQVQKQGLPSQFETRADAEAAEAALTQALEQVRAQKKGLKK